MITIKVVDDNGSYLYSKVSFLKCYDNTLRHPEVIFNTPEGNLEVNFYDESGKCRFMNFSIYRECSVIPLKSDSKYFDTLRSRKEESYGSYTACYYYKAIFWHLGATYNTDLVHSFEIRFDQKIPINMIDKIVFVFNTQNVHCYFSSRPTLALEKKDVYFGNTNVLEYIKTTIDPILPYTRQKCHNPTIPEWVRNEYKISILHAKNSKTVQYKVLRCCGCDKPLRMEFVRSTVDYYDNKENVWLVISPMYYTNNRWWECEDCVPQEHKSSLALCSVSKPYMKNDFLFAVVRADYKYD